jgi:hypothetical protein
MPGVRILVKDPLSDPVADVVLARILAGAGLDER